ncbi:MAG: hypothetical protein UY05_C0052G0003 [Candidatus Peregrinibacteria bacterium GW2011_GWA2_47_7]|nr:MAG: hypothetical protein UY05_C0052G0003 [Candidatus Peregrinibacteria bacterium GW2011_GWA2_47_7]
MLKKIFIGIILNGAALYGVIYFLPEIVYTGGIRFFVLGGLVMGILNSIVRPVLKIITLPLHFLTMGLSLILVNGIIFWIFKIIIATIAVQGITLQVAGVVDYIFAGFLFGIINWVAHLIIHNK